VSAERRLRNGGRAFGRRGRVVLAAADAESGSKDEQGDRETSPDTRTLAAAYAAANPDRLRFSSRSLMILSTSP
jgi:hypothetical protein